MTQAIIKNNKAAINKILFSFFIGYYLTGYFHCNQCKKVARKYYTLFIDLILIEYCVDKMVVFDRIPC